MESYAEHALTPSKAKSGTRTVRELPPRLKELIDLLQEEHGYNLPPEQAAKFLGTTKGALAVRRHEGTGPDYVRFGRSIKYPADSLVDYQLTNLVRTGR